MNIQNEIFEIFKNCYDQFDLNQQPINPYKHPNIKEVNIFRKRYSLYYIDQWENPILNTKETHGLQA